MFVADEVNGTWGPGTEPPGASTFEGESITVNAMSCASAGNCVAGGQYDPSYNDYLELALRRLRDERHLANPDGPHRTGVAGHQRPGDLGFLPVGRQLHGHRLREPRHLRRGRGKWRLGCRALAAGPRHHRRRLLRGNPRLLRHRRELRRGRRVLRLHREERHLGRRAGDPRLTGSGHRPVLRPRRRVQRRRLRRRGHHRQRRRQHQGSRHGPRARPADRGPRPPSCPDSSRWMAATPLR